MNRIILIGNGFDLAHGMKTSYKDFIEDFWGSLIEKPGKLKLIDNSLIKLKPKGIWGMDYDSTCTDNFSKVKFIAKNTKCLFKIKNQFLERISSINYDLKWVDVEDEYYRFLKKSIDFPGKTGGYKIEELNKDFKVIKGKLAEYLKKVESEFKSNPVPNLAKIKETIGSKVYQPFNPSDFSGTTLNEVVKLKLEQLRKNNEALEDGTITLEDLSEVERRLVKTINLDLNPREQVKRTLLSSTAINYFNLNPENLLFLNFNYTNTHNYYNRVQMRDYFWERNLPPTSSINIHGSIYNPEENPIIFGFGDEIDEDYKTIENLNDNKYLENIKSINYLESGNYKSLLQYIEGGYFEIFIFGHSCGISDRTLLNTMFEHDNCASIKLFYHERNKGDDNYSDIVRNISRNFNDKAKMRDKVVNKGSCVALVED